MIEARNDLRHRPTPEMNYSESKWFAFYDERTDFWVSSRIGLEPNAGRANRWLVVAIRKLDRQVRRHPLRNRAWPSPLG